MNKYDYFKEKDGNFFPSRNTVGSEKIKPGIYQAGVTMEDQLYFKSIEPKTDSLIEVANSTSDVVVQDIMNFSRPEVAERFRKYGLVHKRGILMHGPGGTGKTSTIVTICNKLIAEGAVVLFGTHPLYVSEAVKAVKDIQPDALVVLVYEELETWLGHSNHEMLSLLDGELQNEGVIVLATTNYISRIPGRVKDRPSRFALKVEIGVPTREFREAFFKLKLHESDMGRLMEFVESSEGFVVDQMKDLIVSVCCLGYNLSDAVLKINEMKENGTGVDDYQEDYTNEVFMDRKKANSTGSKNPFRKL